MPYENMKNLNQETLAKFKKWIKDIPIQLLNNLTPNKLSKATDININESTVFLHSLYKNDLATIKINVNCSKCGTQNTIYMNNSSQMYECIECGNYVDVSNVLKGEIIYVLKIEYFNENTHQSKVIDPMKLLLKDNPNLIPKKSNNVISIEEVKKEMKSEYKRPRVFIGSSVEGLKVAKAIQAELEHDAESTVWNQGVFNISSTAIDDLIDAFKKMDFAIFVATPDDISKIREKELDVVRDNVIFEIGLSMGIMGRKNVFFVKPRGYENFHFPSDLLGITPGEYYERDDGNIQSAIGPVTTKIIEQIKKLSKEK